MKESSKINHSAKLNQLSLSAVRSLFTTLDPPTTASLSGLHRGLFVGPGWLRASAQPLLAITGLGGWWGKEISQDASTAINLVLRRGAYHRIFPMYFVNQASIIDGQPGLALRYEKDNPFPWPIIVDELRRIDARTVLGMTLVDLNPFRRQAFPFILQAREALDPQ
jgi:hypothetical protein